MAARPILEAVPNPDIVCFQCGRHGGGHALTCPTGKGQAVRLNLGCHTAHVKGYLNVDRCEPADAIVDLACYPWPWGESTVEMIKAWDIFEHLQSKLKTLNEVYRVLMPGGRLDLVVPTTDGRGAFQDPTHVSFWTPNDLFYWCEEYPEWHELREAYGILAHFRIVTQRHEEFPGRVWKLRAILEAVK